MNWGTFKTELSGNGSYGVRTFTHDAWNRLVKVTHTVGGTTHTIGEYEYNGLHWRTLKRADTSSGAYNGLDEFYASNAA